MPELNEEQFKEILELMKNAIPISLKISKDEEAEALELCNKYLQNRNLDINEFSNLSIYFILSKLSSQEQIEFIKKHINKIKENDEDIFLYHMLAPKSLAYFLSYDVLKEIYNIDKDIFKKILNGNTENLLHNFSQEEYIKFFSNFKNELESVDNRKFINLLHCHNRLCYELDAQNDFSINERFSLQNTYNTEFNNFIIGNYKSKINEFDSRDLLSFVEHLLTSTQGPIDYKYFIEDNKEKLKDSFLSCSKDDLKEYLSNLSFSSQELLVSSFPNIIVNKDNVKNIISQISPLLVIELYNQNKNMFSSLTLLDWVKTCCKNNDFKEGFKEILNSYEIIEIESIFKKIPFINNYYTFINVEPLKYIEQQFRDNIQTNQTIKSININTSIFSNDYLKNIKELSILLKSKKIDRTNNLYLKHLHIFKKYIVDNGLISTSNNHVDIEIEKLFYRIVNGASLTLLSKIKSAEDIALMNRLGDKEFDASYFTLEQILNFNVKDYKKLYSKFNENSYFVSNDKVLVLKLLFILGYNRANYLLSIDSSYPTIEHLVGNVDVRNTKLDKDGNPILNKKIINLLFDNKNNPRIKQLLENKTSLLYKYFPRIFNEWDMITMNKKDTSLSSIINFLESDEISLPPKYYRLEGLFKYIGCKNTIVNETIELHDLMLERIDCSIPKIKGEIRGYSYETLDLQDFNSLCVGNKTDCCFTVLGNGYSCLKHALTSTNGRVLVVKKDDKLIAHSWVWRNGNLLCIDNIEVNKNITSVDFLDVYLEFSNKIIHESFKEEGVDSCIRNVTVGFTDFDKPIIGIENYPCLISKSLDLNKNNLINRIGNNRNFVELLPQPREIVGYSDSKNIQYLINGTGDFNYFDCDISYQDERKPIIHLNQETDIDENELERINKIINSLLYIKCELEDKVGKFKYIDIRDYKEIYCNEDWFILITKKGEVNKFIFSRDSRANEEFCNVLSNKIKPNNRI